MERQERQNEENVNYRGAREGGRDGVETNVLDSTRTFQRGGKFRGETSFRKARSRGRERWIKEAETQLYIFNCCFPLLRARDETRLLIETSFALSRIARWILFLDVFPSFLTSFASSTKLLIECSRNDQFICSFRRHFLNLQFHKLHICFSPRRVTFEKVGRSVSWGLNCVWPLERARFIARIWKFSHLSGWGHKVDAVLGSGRILVTLADNIRQFVAS